jgi:uncharacterized membrane protein (DUF2068 family)
MSRTPIDAKAPAKQASSTGILLIGLFKLLKGLLLVAVGIGALKLLHKNVAEVVNHWVDILRVDPDNRLIHATASRLFSVTPKQLKALSVGTFFYAALLLTEGTGLLMRKHWAEYFTVVTTAGLIPLEIYELATHFSWAKIIVLLVNIAIVLYLIVRLRNSRAAPERNHSPATVSS